MHGSIIFFNRQILFYVTQTLFHVTIHTICGKPITPFKTTLNTIYPLLENNHELVGRWLCLYVNTVYCAHTNRDTCWRVEELIVL